jgi:PAS domain S-box-containing protein
MNEPRLYNIKVVNSTINYIKNHYPDVDINLLLEYAEIPLYVLDDLGYWYTQRQSDLFHEILVKKTGNANIKREAGRFILKSGSYNTVRQYILGFITVETAFSATELIISKLTRGGTMKMRKLGHNKVEVIARPAKDVMEKPYQCDVRLGFFEAVPEMFINKLADIEHPLCLHKGDEYCKYIISWDEPASFKLKLFRNYLSLLYVILFLASFIFLPFFYSIIIFLVCSAIILGLSTYYERKKQKELVHASESQGNTAGQLLEEINNRFNNALLVQETGQAISSILDMEDLFKCIMQILEKRTDFDRGIILLANDNITRLIYKTGYGYDKAKEQILRNTEFHLDRPESKGIFIKTFKEQKPFLINDVNDIVMDISLHSKEFADLIGTKSFITAPIVFKEKSLGILVVDNISNKRPLTMSDMNLLSGIAQQIGISINNARSFLQLQASKEKYRELVEDANSIIIRIDTEGRIIFFNEFAQKFFAYTEEELLGKNLIGALLPYDNQNENKLQRMLNEIEKNPEEYLNIQTENIVKNMKRVWIAWTNRPIFGSEGKLKEILCVGNDITELRRVEEKIKHLNEVLLAILNIDQLITHEKDRDRLIKSICDKLALTNGHMGAWIVLFDEKTKFNRAFETGVSGDFNIFLKRFKDENMPGCCRMALSQTDTVVIDNPDIKCGDCEFKNKYCKIGRILNRLGYDDKIYGIMSVEVIYDFISNNEEAMLLKEVADEIAFALYNIELEQERKNLQEQLFRSAKLSAVGQLAAGVAHEFNNILHVILGHTQLSMDENSIPNIKESLQHIEKSTKRGSSLVQRLSEFAKPQEPDFEIQDIAEVIQETVKLQKKQIQLENIDVRLEFGEHSKVLFDSDQMQQVFLNLLINAIHAIKHKGGENTIIITALDKDRQLEIRFSDTGCGMSRETMNKIFDPFFSTKGAWAKDNLGITGTGLGLSVTHAIIKQHNGTISVESEEGKGTTFIIKLPIPEGNELKKIKEIFNKINIDNEKSKYLKIMVIDDEEEMINLMKLTFKKNGFNNILTEKDGSQAARIFREFCPDVVFLDMLMPITNGEQVFEELKSINPAVPVIFMTGKLDGKMNEYKNMGAYDFLKKPFKADNIFQILNKIAGERESATATK